MSEQPPIPGSHYRIGASGRLRISQRILLSPRQKTRQPGLLPLGSSVPTGVPASASMTVWPSYSNQPGVVVSTWAHFNI